MMKFHILTLFPEMVMNGLNTSIIGRAAAQGLIVLDAVNIRDYTQDKHGKVDDYPYGGGAGMLMQAQPVFDAYMAASGGKRIRTVYVTPQGRPFTQRLAEEFAKDKELVFLCGHYEGIDERVLEELVTDYVSIGDYVLTGGELPAMVMIDAISRLIPGVLNNEMSAETESFHNDLLEYPQYSRPELWHEKKVPQVLLSGNHKNIMKWRLEKAMERTAQRRPDLFARYQEKQQVMKDLARKKREHIHLTELLRRGNGEVLYHESENVLLYDRKGGAYMMTAADAAAMERFRERLPGKATLFAVSQDFLAAMLEAEYDTKVWMQCYQACYTRREPLPVKHKDIRRLDLSFLDALEAHYHYCDREYLRDRIQSGMMYGAFCKTELLGFIGVHAEGSMGMLYVEEAYRGRGIGASLEAFLINRLLELDWTPFCQVEVGNKASLRLQEKLGLYLSAGTLWWLEREEKQAVYPSQIGCEQ